MPVQSSLTRSVPLVLPEAVRLMEEAALELGLTFRLLDPEGGHLFELSDGRITRTFLGGRSPLNDAVASRIADDKYYTELLLRRAGFRVPQSVRCLKPGAFSAEYAGQTGHSPAQDWVRRHDLPLVVKPNRLSHGRHVQLVYDEQEMVDAILRVWEFDSIALVQTPHAGVDVRLDFLDTDYLVGYTRTQAEGASERESLILNLTLGARAEPLPAVSDAWHRHGLAVGRALGLRYFGIDFKAPSMDADPADATVIEVNSSPLFVQMALQGHRAAALAAQKRVLSAVWGLS